MTISIAWIRKVQDYEQLVFVSDSRISGGKTFDACPKILALPRNDCAIAFAGDTGHGFSMMLQLSLAIESYPPAKRGALELAKIRSHAKKVFNAMNPLIRSTVKGREEGDTTPGATFLFGGYSWRKKHFELWTFTYASHADGFIAHRAPTLCYDRRRARLHMRHRLHPDEDPIARIAFAGDQSGAAKELLCKRLFQRVEQGEPLDRIDMEPFTIVRDMLRDPSLRRPPHSETIGGAPQVVRVFQYHRTAPFAVFWPDRSGAPHLHGRPCLSYEQIDKQAIDPDSLEEIFVKRAAPRDDIGIERANE